MDRDNQQETATDIEIGWLAGLLDGEGSIVLQINNRANRTQTLRITPQVIFTNTDAGIIEGCAQVLNKLGVGRYVMHSRPNNVGLVTTASKDITYIHVSGLLRVNKLLKVIGIHLKGDKKLRAEVLGTFIDRRLSEAQRLNSGANYKYDADDVRNIMEFMRLTRSKNIDHYSRLLNEHTRSAPHSMRAMMCSELYGNAERMQETAPAVT